MLNFRQYLARLLAVTMPMVLALLLAWFASLGRGVVDGSMLPLLQPITVNSSAQLAQLFAEQDYTWPPRQAVPLLALQNLPHDLEYRPVEEKKALFFQSLLPLVLAENRRLETERAWLEGLLQQHALSEQDGRKLAELLQHYRIDVGLGIVQQIHLLLRHVDRVPVALVLAQAANESGWGGSRFVREANNLFGEWTWQADEGIAPLIRNAESRHYVRRFGSLAESVRSYMYNINVGHAYEDLRAMRAQMRAQGQRPFDALKLASGLLRYSERGEDYVSEIQAMIRGNRLHQLDNLELSGQH